MVDLGGLRSVEWVPAVALAVFQLSGAEPLDVPPLVSACQVDLSAVVVWDVFKNLIQF